MPTYALPSETSINFTEGPHQIFIYIAGQIPQFIPLMLIAFFMIVNFTGYFLQERRKGDGDFPMWFSIAGYLTVGLAFLLSLIEGLINPSTVIISLSVAIMGFVWFSFSR